MQAPLITPPHTHDHDYGDELRGVIDGFLADRLSHAAAIHPHYAELWQEVGRLLGTGGKRLRSRMVLLSYSLFGGDDVHSILPAAAAQELLHVGMLIHDDIIDRDYIRYGIDNVAGGYKKRYAAFVADDAERLHYAHSAAILGGDLLLSEAYLLMAESNVDAEKIIAVQRLLGRGIFEVIGGELLDTETAFRGDGIATPEDVALYKTASYTFTLPFLVGALLAGASEEDQAYIRTFGSNLGIAFQLRDDIIGVFGDEAETGKSSTGDIREGKRTYMVELFYELASESQRAEFDNRFGKQSLTNEQCDDVRALLKDSGALAQTEQSIAEYEAKARRALEQMTVTQSFAGQLEQLIQVATKRSK